MTDITITRSFAAPRETVFRAWTEAKLLADWWAPKGMTTPYCKVDLRPGGLFHYCMRSAEGTEYWGKGVYREIVECERIVYVDSFADPEGNTVSPTLYGLSESHPLETLVTVAFVEHGDHTLVTLHHALDDVFSERDATHQGWDEMLDRLADLLNRELNSEAPGS